MEKLLSLFQSDEVLDTSEFFFTVCTAGHVDHGKTSVIKRLTGIDPDRLKEEKLRQMTTDLGFAHMSLSASDSLDVSPDTCRDVKNPHEGSTSIFKVGFIDVPGHGKFLKNMLAGVGCLDMALLVVAAPESVMPQTRQHAEILHLLGVDKVVTVITKIDLCSPLETEESEKATRLLLSDLGLNDLGMVRVSCASNTGFDRLVDLLRQSLSLIARQRKESSKSRPVFLPIDRVFKKAGFGSVITGTLARGQLRPDDSVFVLPDKVKARVRKLESFGEPVDLAGPGQRLAVNLALKEEIKLERGSILSGVEIDPRQDLLVLLQHPYAKLGRALPELATGAVVRLYHGTGEYQGSVGWCASEPNSNGCPESTSVGALSVSKQFAQVHIHEPCFGEPGDRVIIRAPDDSIIGGTILARVRLRSLNRASTIEFLSRLARQDFEGATLCLVDSDRQKMVHKRILFEFIPHDVHERVLKELGTKGNLIGLADYLVLSSFLAQLEDKVVAELESMLTDSSKTTLENSLSLEKLRTSRFGRIDRETFAILAERLGDRGKIKKEGNQLFSVEFVASPHAGIEESVLFAVEEKLAQQVCIELVELAKQLGTDLETVKRAAKALELQGKIRVVSREFVSSSKSILRAHAVLEEIWREEHQISPSEFKERLSITRKYAMPLLSFFDDELITRRVGAGRVLLKTVSAEKLS